MKVKKRNMVYFRKMACMAMTRREKLLPKTVRVDKENAHRALNFFLTHSLGLSVKMYMNHTLTKNGKPIMFDMKVRSVLDDKGYETDKIRGIIRIEEHPSKDDPNTQYVKEYNWIAFDNIPRLWSKILNMETGNTVGVTHHAEISNVLGYFHHIGNQALDAYLNDVQDHTVEAYDPDRVYEVPKKEQEDLYMLFYAHTVTDYINDAIKVGKEDIDSDENTNHRRFIDLACDAIVGDDEKMKLTKFYTRPISGFDKKKLEVHLNLEGEFVNDDRVMANKEGFIIMIDVEDILMFDIEYRPYRQYNLLSALIDVYDEFKEKTIQKDIEHQRACIG